VMLGVAIHEQHASAVHRNDLDDVVNEVIEDRLDREIARQRAGKVHHQHRREPFFVHRAPLAEEMMASLGAGAWSVAGLQRITLHRASPGLPVTAKAARSSSLNS